MKISEFMTALNERKREGGDMQMAFDNGFNVYGLSEDQLEIVEDEQKRILKIARIRLEDMEPVRFEIDYPQGNNTYKKHLVYDFKKIPLPLASAALEIAKYRHDQQSVGVESVRDIINSETAKWKTIVAAHILLETDDKGNIIPYEPRQARRIEDYLYYLPHDEKNKLEACIDDFFFNQGFGNELSQIRQWKKPNNQKELLEKVLMYQKLMQISTSKSSSSSAKSTSRESSGDVSTGQ